mmetsp:Transcript_60385/g.174878  ORF Transcript_60385/g.174878 Transcript_60385/m.174878 type:complete len:224 (-) Transcript_60385:616-1287(-)
MDGGVPSALVALLNVDLDARHAADAVGVAVVVLAVGRKFVLLHRHEVQGDVATAAGAGHVRGVAQSLSEQPQAQVTVRLVGPWLASLGEVRAAFQARGNDAAIGDLHRSGRFSGNVPRRAHERGLAEAAHIEVSQALRLLWGGFRLSASRAAGAAILRLDAVAGTNRNRRYREVIEAHGLGARRGVVGIARPEAVCASPVEPQHVVVAPEADHRRHAALKGLR